MNTPERPWSSDCSSRRVAARRRATVRQICTEAAMNNPLIEQACGCSTVRGGGGCTVRARLCRRHSCGECLPPRPATCLQFGLHRGRHGAPTARASFELLYSTRRWRMHGACSTLPLAFVRRVLAATTNRLQFGEHWRRHEQPADRASLQLLYSPRWWRMQGACSSLPPALMRRVLATTTRHLQFGLHWSSHGAPTARASLRLLYGARW